MKQFLHAGQWQRKASGIAASAFAAAFLFACASAAFGQGPPPPQSAKPATPDVILEKRAPIPVVDPLISLEAKQSMPPLEVDLVVPEGIPLRVMLKKTIPVKEPGQAVIAYVTEAVYAFDRIVIPKGSEVDGHITQLVSPSGFKRTGNYLNADFSSHRRVEVTFDTLVLADGTRMSLLTRVVPDAGPVVKLEANPQKSSEVKRARGMISRQVHGTLAALKPSTLWRHAKSFLWGELPYHKQKLVEGTVFDAELVRPLDFGLALIPPEEMGAMGQIPAESSEAYARLDKTLSSATAQVGWSVEAILTRPVFSKNEKLLLPAGSQLQGSVVKVRPARWFHRNGQLHFNLIRVVLPSGTPQPVEMALEGIEVAKSSNIQMDSEGSTRVASNSKSRVLNTALSIAIANSTLDADSGHAGATATSENRPLGGVLGFKLVGLAVSLAARYPPLSQAMGFAGAGRSVYSNFFSRGKDLVLPKDTPIEVSFGEHRKPMTAADPKRK
ncbi:MAG TPA: hypothetical protein VGR81_03425 [Candidatus Acidoferrales bacterium]|nr:hypothetical protein [Candidatus Acidoferrales bacterium]